MEERHPPGMIAETPMTILTRHTHLIVGTVVTTKRLRGRLRWHSTTWAHVEVILTVFMSMHHHHHRLEDTPTVGRETKGAILTGCQIRLVVTVTATVIVVVEVEADDSTRMSPGGMEVVVVLLTMIESEATATATDPDINKEDLLPGLHIHTQEVVVDKGTMTMATFDTGIAPTLEGTLGMGIIIAVGHLITIGRKVIIGRTPAMNTLLQTTTMTALAGMLALL